MLVFPCCLTTSQAGVDGGYGGATLVLPCATGLLQGAMGLFWLLTMLMLVPCGLRELTANKITAIDSFKD